MLRLISPQHPAWLKMINDAPEAMIFHHPAWTTNLRECYGYKDWVAVVIKDDDIVAGLPIMEVKGFLGKKRLISLPFSDYCRPLARNPAAIENLAKDLVEWARREVLPIEVRWRLPGQIGIKTISDYVLHTTELAADAEMVFERIHRKVRKYIRSSVNRGVRVEKGTGDDFLRQFYHHQLLTRRKHGLPAQPWKYFEGLGRNIMEKGLGFVLLAYYGDKCLAGLIVLHWGQTLTLKYGASAEEHLSELRPNHLLDWMAIRWGCENGYKVLDVGRSDVGQMGLRDYKNRWGYREETLEYSYIACEPPVNRTSGVIGQAFRSVIQRSPLWLCQAAGDLLYVHFP